MALERSFGEIQKQIFGKGFFGFVVPKGTQNKKKSVDLDLSHSLRQNKKEKYFTFIDPTHTVIIL